MPSRTVRRTLASVFATLLGSDIAPLVSYVRLHGFTLGDQNLLEGLLVVVVLVISVLGLIIVGILEGIAARYGTSGMASVWRAVRLIILPILATAYLSWLVDPVFEYLGLNANFRLVSILVVTAGLVVIANLVWTHEPARFLILMNSQRTRFIVLLAAFIGTGFAAFCLATLTRKGIIQQFASVPMAGIVGIVVLAFIGSCLLLLWRRSWVQISAAHCVRVLQRIEQNAPGGIYMFPEGAKSSDVLRESRILQYLAHQSKQEGDKSSPTALDTPNEPALPKVIPQFWHYRLEPTPSRAETQLSQAILINNANYVWRKGGKRRAWRAVGTRMPVPMPHFKLFGSELDKLFNNGHSFIFHGAEGPRLVTMVIKGQPGAGKSTLALQACVTLARQGFVCVYYSLEEEREGLLQSVRGFGWSRDQVAQNNRTAPSEQAYYAGIKYSELERGYTFRRRLREVRKNKGNVGDSLIPVGVVLVSSLGYRAMSVKARTRRLRKEWEEIDGELPRCVVIDSLEGFANVGLEGSQDNNVPRDHLIALKNFFRDRCELLIILDEDDGSGKPSYVDFVADAVIQLGRRLEEDYTVLYAEVVKARNQTHALGKHQIKIRSEQDLKRLRREVVTSASVANDSVTASGIQLFPSLHFRLSQAAKSPTFDYRFLSSGLSALDTMLDTNSSAVGGLRRLTSNVLVGPSGTGKSVIAMNFLVEGVRENTPTLLISLHEDPRTLMAHRPPQERDRIIFDWKTEETKESNGVQAGRAAQQRAYHTFRWSVKGISQWVRSLAVEGTAEPNEAKLRRLPYLFREGPVSFQRAQEDGTFKKQGIALYTFLKAVADEASTHSSWDASAKAAMRAAYDDAWQAFEDVWKESLLHTAVDQRKKLHLVWLDESDGPSLAWDSRKWVSDAKDTNDASQGHLEPDTTLLQIMYQRPGYVTPEEFIEKLLGVIGQPGEDSRFERVVLDDVAQIPLRFPLLAKSKLFLPSLLDILRAEGITTLFLQDNRSQVDSSSDKEYGLEIMADHVIRTEIRPIKALGGSTDDETREPQVIVRSDAPPGVLWQPGQELTISGDGYVTLETLRQP